MRRLLLLSTSAILVAPPVAAQSSLDGRVGRLESEMRAVQRKVFPGGASIEPQIAPPDAPPAEIGTPATAPIADLTQRVASLEQQLATMTGQIEQTQNRLRLLEDQVAAARREAATPPPPAAVDPVPDASASVPPPPRRAAPQPPASATATGGIVRPSTGQADEDDYIYGYRLYAAKRYPEAITQLKKVVATYPRSRRASFAQNLVGRAYLDDGKPNLAATSFYENYKKMPEGERAPESLFYLGQSLARLNKPADACKVYGELSDVYAGKIPAQMQGDIARARTAAKCK